MEKYGTAIITRTKNKQIEENKKMGYKAIFDVVWIDDCTYKLRNKKVIKGNGSPYDKPGNILMVKIIEINESSIIVHSSSNFSDFEVDMEMEIVK